MTTSAFFPQNLIDVVSARLDVMMADHAVVQRAVRTSDATNILGVFAEDWTPNEASREIGPQSEPVLARYTIKIQNMVASMDEQVGREKFSINAKSVRGILARDTTLHDSLRGLSEELLGTREKVQRLGVSRQRFVVGALSGTWTFLATTDLWVETEATQL